jgi:hypothetical protein
MNSRRRRRMLIWPSRAILLIKRFLKTYHLEPSTFGQ